MAIRHLQLAAADKGERSAVLEMRRHGAWYIKGLPGASAVRSRLMRTTGAAGVLALLEDYRRSLLDGRPPAGGREQPDVGEGDIWGD
jgi:tRNA-dihydrouridine synthase